MNRLLHALLIILLTSGLSLARETGTHPISGRHYAHVMGYMSATWLDREERDVDESPDLALDALDIKVGEVVADIGAGTGYITIRLAKRVGSEGRVYAEDIQRKMIDRIKKLIALEKLGNVVPMLGSTDDPGLPPASLDLALLVDVYHELSEPQKMLQRLRESLKQNGRLVLIEYRNEDAWIPIESEHKMTVGQAKMEVESEGFTLSKVDERLPRQHILIFTRYVTH